MLEPQPRSSFEGASQAPTVAESTSSIAGDKDVDTYSTQEKTSQFHSTDPSMDSNVQPMAPAPTEAEKVVALTKQATARSHNSNALRQTQTREDGVEYPTGMKLFLISLALCLSVFLIALE